MAWVLNAYAMLWLVFLAALAPFVATAIAWEMGARLERACLRRARR